MKASKQYVDSLEFHMMPQDRGQIIDVRYACDEDGVWAWSHDKSNRSDSYDFAKYNARATELQLSFEPQNGKLPRHNKWNKVTITN